MAVIVRRYHRKYRYCTFRRVAQRIMGLLQCVCGHVSVVNPCAVKAVVLQSHRWCWWSYFVGRSVVIKAALVAHWLWEDTHSQEAAAGV